MDIRQSQKLNQKLTLTPQMRQSLRILKMPLLELKDCLEAQIEENPALKREDVPGEDSLFAEKIEKLLKKERGSLGPGLSSVQEDIQKRRDYKNTLISKASTLEEHLLKQLRISLLNKKDYKIGEHILSNLDENGYLNLSIGEIMVKFNRSLSLGEKITRKTVENVLSIIYHFDPPGIGARNLKECLLIQLRLENKESSLAYKIVDHYLSKLIKGNLKIIAKKLKISPGSVKKAVKEISCLNPRPGKALESTTAQIIAPSLPDIIVEKANNKLEVVINTKFLPTVKINDYYLNLLKSKKISAETKKYIQDRIASALGFIKSISQREETIRKIVQTIIKVQKAFFEQGDKSLFKPLTHKTIAKIVKRNESTVSRVVNSKYIQTPYGTFRLNYFFSKSLENHQGKKISQEYVKHLILDILTDDGHKNLKDSEIVKRLKEQGVKIARRTVAKYRNSLKIPAYYQRKRKD